MHTVISDKCPQDHLCPCVQMCPVGAISQQDFQVPEINRDRCVYCGICADFCPYKAFAVVEDGDRAANLS